MQCSHFPYINFQISLITLIRRGSAYLQQPYPLQPDMRLDPKEEGSYCKPDLIQEQEQFQPLPRSQFVPAGVSTFPDPVSKFFRLVIADPTEELGLQCVGPSTCLIFESGNLDRSRAGRRSWEPLGQLPLQRSFVLGCRDQIQVRRPNLLVFAVSIFVERQIDAPDGNRNMRFCERVFNAPMKFAMENNCRLPGTTVEPDGTMLIAISSPFCVSKWSAMNRLDALTNHRCSNRPHCGHAPDRHLRLGRQDCSKPDRTV